MNDGPNKGAYDLWHGPVEYGNHLLARRPSWFGVNSGRECSWWRSVADRSRRDYGAVEAQALCTGTKEKIDEERAP